MAQKTNSMTLDINVVSARGLTEVHYTSKTKLYLYAVVSITGAAQNEQKARTHVDKEGGGNPTWNFPVKFAVDVDGLKRLDIKTRLVLAIKWEDGKGHRDLGEVHVSIEELLSSAGDGNFMRYVAVLYPVKNASGLTAGVLNFEYKFSGSQMSDSPAACFATRNIGGYPPQGYYPPPSPSHYMPPPPPPAAAGYGGCPPSAHPNGPYPPTSPSHYMPPPPYPPYNVGPSAAPPYAYPHAYYPSHPSHVQAHAPPVVQRLVPKKKKSGVGSALGMVGALAVGLLSVGSEPSLDFSSVPDVSGLSSGFQIPDPSAYAPPDFFNLYTLPDPSSTFNIDYSSFT